MAVPGARLALLLALPLATEAGAAERVELGGFAIDRTEVTVARFTEFTKATGLVTAAEREGGGHEWGSGWERRPGWTFRAPFGAPAGDVAEPAVHVSWFEARDFCAWAGGRLPMRAEWEAAAYREEGPGVGGGFQQGTTYTYPTGETSDGANTSGNDPWPRHAPAGVTKAGINGLHDMGGNAWEWLADREGGQALTAGGSWWYGADKMLAGAMQWKPADFYVVYIGFRCVYDVG